MYTYIHTYIYTCIRTYYICCEIYAHECCKTKKFCNNVCKPYVILYTSVLKYTGMFNMKFKIHNK